MRQLFCTSIEVCCLEKTFSKKEKRTKVIVDISIVPYLTDKCVSASGQKTLTASACPERGFCASSTGWWTTDSGESAAPASRGCLSSSSPASPSPSRWPRTWSQTPAAPGGPGGCWWSPGPAVPASQWVRRQGTWRPTAWFPRRKKHASNISGVTGKKNWK